MSVAAEVEAFAAYRNGLARARAEMDRDELAQYEQDMAKARAEMEVAWLEHGVAR